MSTFGPGSIPTFTGPFTDTHLHGPFPTGGPTGSQQNNNNGGGGGPSSSLYLFTFLATLLLLLFVSFCIVLRSYMLRRRYRQQLEGAVTEGYFLPSPFSRIPLGKEFGEKPKLWDLWILPSTVGAWRDVSPMSAKLVSKSDEKTELEPTRPSPAVDHNQPHILSVFVGFPRRSRRDAARDFSPTPLSPCSPSSTSLDSGEKQTGVQVSVLIAMPSPHDRWLKSGVDYKKEELPEVSLGVAQVPYL